MSPRASRFLYASVLAVLLLAGCGSDPQTRARPAAAESVRQAVQQDYRAEHVNVVLRRAPRGDEPRLEIALVNPGGREATTHESARTVARTAQAQYEKHEASAVPAAPASARSGTSAPAETSGRPSPSIAVPAASASVTAREARPHPSPMIHEVMLTARLAGIPRFDRMVVMVAPISERGSPRGSGDR